MAYEALKTLIRQYIKPNEQEEITGAILQGILLEMVNQLGVAGNYLPLTGGNITGNVIVSNDPTATTHNAVRLTQSGVTIENIASVGLNEVLALSANSIIYQSYFPNATPSTMAINFGMTGITMTGGITASSFVNSSVEQSVRGNYLLKADGNVVSISDIGGGVDMSVVWASLAASTNEQIAASHLSTVLSGYLPLTGGNIDGNLSIYDTMNIYSSSIEWNDDGDYSRIAFDDDGITVTAHGTGYIIANEFVKNGGTSSEFLKADGSVDSNTYITASALTGYATQSWVTTQLGSYLPLTGGTLTGNLELNNSGLQVVLSSKGKLLYTTSLSGYNIDIIEYQNDGISIKSISRLSNDELYFSNQGVKGTSITYNSITSGSFIKENGTSAQFLKADGSVDSNTYITASALTGYATQSWVTTQLASYNPTTNFKTINGNSIIGSGDIVISGGGSGNYVPAYSPIGYNVNICYNSGLYLVQSGSNTPFGNQFAELLTLSYRKLTGNTIPDFAAQIIFPNGDDRTLPNAMFYRTSVKYSWNAWQQVFTTSGGTITGNLTIKNSKAVSSTLYIIDGEGSYTHRIVADDDGLNIYCGNDLYFNAVGDFYFVNKSVAVGTYSTSYKLTVDGQVGATGFVNTSDLRKKNIMGDVPMNIYNVANAPLFKFTWNDEKEYSGHHIGSAAQYWQTVLPELVSIGRDADMTLAMQYDVIALASAITVAKTVVNHEERIILLERENEALKKEIADLKSA